MGDMIDPFEVLGMPSDATPEEVKARYHELAAKYHPDKGGSDEEMARINAAYKAAHKWASLPKACPACGGSGYLTQTQGWYTVNVICGACNGKKRA